MRENENNNNSGSGITLDSVMDWLQTYQSNGVRELTDAEKQFLADNNIAVEVAKNTESEYYFVIPADQHGMLNDEAMANINAAKEGNGGNGGAGTSGTAGTAGSAGTFYCVACSCASSSVSTTTSVATAGSSGSVNLATIAAHPTTDLQKQKAETALGVLSQEYDRIHQ